MDIEKVRQIAELARLELDDEEARRLASEFSEVLGMFDRLDEVECEGGMVMPVEPDAELRDDVPAKPSGRRGYVKGPRTVG